MAFEIVSSGQLRQYIEKIERLEGDKAELLNAIREVFAEAKSNGFNTKTMKQILKMRKMKYEDRVEQEEILMLYLQSLEMVSSSSKQQEIEEDA